MTVAVVLEQVLQYVEDVLAERVSPNNAAGRQLLELVNSLPNLSADTFADAFASSVKDLLMVKLSLITGWFLQHMDRYHKTSFCCIYNAFAPHQLRRIFIKINKFVDKSYLDGHSDCDGTRHVYFAQTIIKTKMWPEYEFVSTEGPMKKNSNFFSNVLGLDEAFVERHADVVVNEVYITQLLPNYYYNYYQNC